ncbi:MAG TPA: hypothetical protein VEV17_11590 [Bryobacteraceae bacterium]|nr:hypothetical protein [Bryobacteraceae bacterium]
MKKDGRSVSRRMLLERVKRMFQHERPEPPDDPYALVGAPKKPRPPTRSSSVAELPPR